MCHQRVTAPAREALVDRDLMHRLAAGSDQAPGRSYSDGDVVCAATSRLDDGDDTVGEIEAGRAVVVDQDPVASSQRIPLKRQHQSFLFGSRTARHGGQAHQSKAIQGSAS